MCTVFEASLKTGIYRILDNIYNLRIRATLVRAASCSGPGGRATIDRAAVEQGELHSEQGEDGGDNLTTECAAAGQRYDDENTPSLSPHTITQQFQWQDVTKTKNNQRNDDKNRKNHEGNSIRCYLDEEYQADEMRVTTGLSPEMTLLQKEMNKLKLAEVGISSGDKKEAECDDAGRIRGNGGSSNVGGASGYPTEEFNLKKTLEKCIKEPFYQSKLETIYIVADLGKKDPETNIWLKSEQLLCTLRYDTLNKMLYVYPDFTKNKGEPYIIEIGGDTKIIYEYYIENISNEKTKEYQQKENEILQKIIKRNREQLNQIIGTDFLMPPKNYFMVHLFFEISTARDFEYDDIYVQYNIELPESWKCEEDTSLCGSTQTCKTKGWERIAHFGHNFHISLEYNVKNLEKNEIPKVPYIYFQIISRDFWDRYRCEGISYKAIPIFQPGVQNFQLQCIRVCAKNPIGDMRRYFIGDYGNIDDISWIGLPKGYEDAVINKFGVLTIGTGTIKIKLNVINQSKQLIKRFDQSEEGKGDFPSIQLVKSVEEVVSAFKKAQERMQKARKLVMERKKLKETSVLEQ